MLQGILGLRIVFGLWLLRGYMHLWIWFADKDQYDHGLTVCTITPPQPTNLSFLTSIFFMRFCHLALVTCWKRQKFREVDSFVESCSIAC